MSDAASEEELERLLQLLSDPSALAERGASPEWIARCTRLVREFRALQRRARELESVLSALDDDDDRDDTLVL